MEYISAELRQVLDSVTQPAFLVHDATIRYANPGACALPVTVGRPVSMLLGSQNLKYTAYDGSGALSLPLRAGTTRCQALIRRIRHGDLFLLTPETDEDDTATRLDAFFIAAQRLRLPLSNLFATASRLFPYLEDFEDPAIELHVATLNKYFHQLLRSVGNMSDAATLQNGSLVMRFEQLELYGYLREQAEEIGAMCLAAGRSFFFDCPTGSFFGSIDPARFQRAVLNLISNALHHTPKGGEIRMVFERGGTHSTLSIIDNGSGMQPAALGLAFRRFAEQPDFDPNAGIGLGLPIARWIAALHGGTLIIDSRPGRGTTAIMSFMTGQNEPVLRTPAVSFGGFDPLLVELSDVLPTEIYNSENVN